MKAKSLFILSVLTLVVMSLACQSTGPLNNLFATSTPTATATFTPSPTPSPTPTSTITPTPLPSGRIKEGQPDGSTIITDYDGKYQITFPARWIVVITQKDVIEEMLKSAPDSDLKPLLEPLKNSDDDMLRILCFSFKDTFKGYTPTINIVQETSPILSEMSIGNLVNTNKDILPTMIKDVKVIDTGIKTTSPGIDIGFIKIAWEANFENGQQLTVRQKQVYFKSGNNSMAITLSENRDSSTDLEPEFDKIIDSLRLLGK